jgi:HEAT repeat protein
VQRAVAVQGAAIETLIGIGDVAAVPHLLDYLRDDSEYVRRAAVERVCLCTMRVRLRRRCSIWVLTGRSSRHVQC